MHVGTAQPPRRLFTVDEYERMVEAGVFGEDDRLELLEGEVVAMSPIGAAHAGHVNRLNRLFARRLGDRAIVAVQNPVRLERSEPQPDLALLRPRPDDYTRSHPEPGDIMLIVEVADVSGEYDRTVKIPLYAAAGIPETWLVDLGGGSVEVYRGPSATGYKEKRTMGGSDALTVLALANLVLQVSEMLVP